MDFQVVVKNTGLMTVSTMLNKVMQFVVGILLARYLGLVGFGLYSAAYAFVNIFSYFHELGVSQLMVQDCSRDRTKLSLYFGNALFVKVVAIVVVSVFMFAVLLICWMWLDFDTAQCMMIIILGIAMGFYNVSQTFFSYYQTIEKMSVTAGFQFLQALLIAIMTLGVLFVTHNGAVLRVSKYLVSYFSVSASQGATAVTATHLISYVLITVLLLLVLRKQPKPIKDVSKLPKMVGEGLPFGLQRAVSSIIPNATIFVMSILVVSSEEVAIFRAAQILVITLVFLPNTFAYAIYPILFRLGAGEQIRHQTAMEKVFKILAAVGIPVSFFFCVFSTEIIGLIYGAEYSSSAVVFAVLSWYFALECLSYPLGEALMTRNRQWQRTIMQGVCLILLVGLTLWAQPRYGLMGSSWSILLVEGFLFLGYYLYIRVRMYPIRIWRQLPSVLMSSALAIGLAYLIRNWHVVLVACLAAMVYFAVLFAIDKDLRQLLLRILFKGSTDG
ncbi:MAG: flippase [Peptococcaceae bacterium]|nr:flippase [Peptococcaceae bacterium]